MRTFTVGKYSYLRAQSRATRIALQACALIWLLVTCDSGNAQQTGYQPRADPRLPETSFDSFQREHDRDKRAAIQMPTLAKPEVAADTTPLFKLTAVFVDGASVMPADRIAATYRPYLGRTVSQADLVAIAENISNLYRGAGYHLSRTIVPPQDIKDGRIRVRVIEGKIAEIVLNGKEVDQFGIRSLLQPVIDEQPSRQKTLERQLLLVNNRPGVRITDSSLAEIGTASGNFRLTVTVETWRIFMTQSLDNWGAPPLGPAQAYSTSAFNSYLMSGDSLAVNLALTPDATPELRFARVSYDVPIGQDGARLGATAFYSEFWPSDERRLFDTRDQIQNYELRGSIVPLQSRASSLSLTAAANYTDDAERDALGLIYSDHIRAASLTADYKLRDDLNGWNYLTVIVRQGLDILGASQKDDPFTSRAGASGVFTALDFSFARYQPLSDVWSLKLSASGQWASMPLLFSQQFFLGGAAYGPAYYSGDNGIAASAELRFDQTLSFDLLKGYQLYGFIDRGGVWNVDNSEVFSLSSIGVGMRLYLTSQLQAGLAVAVPFRYHITANDVSDQRILFSLSNTFKLCPDRPQMRCL
jgi:hemolysin activation/secretion protein